MCTRPNSREKKNRSNPKTQAKIIQTKKKQQKNGVSVKPKMTERERVSERFCTHDKIGRIPGRKTIRTTEEKEEERKKNITKYNTQQHKSNQINSKSDKR